MIKPLLSSSWFSRLSHFNKLIVGFSGGLDSTVLLHVLASQPTLFSKLVAVHVNHGISANASSWQKNCEQFCQNSGIPFIAYSVQFDRSANIEERGRIARYEVFSSLITEKDCLILGHHLNDQAETVLLQLFRGSGVDGLAAMSDFSQLGRGVLTRPFLNHSREHLEHYANLHQLSWIEDESNLNTNYSRNFLRMQIIPLLKSKWPGVEGNIARAAIHCQQAKKNLDTLAVIDFSMEEKKTGLLAPVDFQKTLAIDAVSKLSFERIVNVLRFWLKNNQIQMPSTATFSRLIHEVIYANHDAAPEVCWGDILVRRYQRHLFLDKKNKADLPSCVEWSGFPLTLILGISEINLTARKAKQGLVIPPKAKIFVKFRTGGEEFFWHGQTKRLKKLFQDWGIPPWLRERIPLVYFDDKLAAVVGYAMSDLFFDKESADAWVFNQSNCSRNGVNLR
ncbi:MAG: tRNA lysidine(34) synthetase TilS [Legionella longbeachae]|nr:tRNA lysidine(34) synthetase TilS [Legionella longbeachae]